MHSDNLLKAALIGHRRDGRPIYLMAGAAEEGGEAQQGQGAEGSEGEGGNGKQYVPPQSQEEFDAAFTRRFNREKAKLAGQYDEQIEALTARNAELEGKNASESEKAIAAARKDEQTRAIPRVVRAEFKAAAKGVLSEEQLTSLLEDLDLSKYADAKGEPKGDKIASKVNAFAPAQGGAGNGSAGSRNLGQGIQTPVQPKPGERGRAEAEKRFGKRS